MKNMKTLLKKNKFACYISTIVSLALDVILCIASIILMNNFDNFLYLVCAVGFLISVFCFISDIIFLKKKMDKIKNAKDEPFKFWIDNFIDKLNDGKTIAKYDIYFDTPLTTHIKNLNLQKENVILLKKEKKKSKYLNEVYIPEIYTTDDIYDTLGKFLYTNLLYYFLNNKDTETMSSEDLKVICYHIIKDIITSITEENKKTT